LYRRILGAFLVCLIGVLTPLALSTPPDPLWIGGLWDDDDFDDVILIITGKLHAVAIVPTLDAEPCGRPALVEETPQRFILSAPPSTSDSRAPPAAAIALS